MNEEKIYSRLEKIRHFIHLSTELVQYILAAIILIGIIVQLTGLPSTLSTLYAAQATGFHSFLEYVIDMVIGVELIHLLCRPNLDNVVEVLLIAITREVVLNNSGPLSMLASIVCIAILFAIRKYLFIDKLDKGL